MTDISIADTINGLIIGILSYLVLVMTNSLPNIFLLFMSLCLHTLFEDCLHPDQRSVLTLLPQEHKQTNLSLSQKETLTAFDFVVFANSFYITKANLTGIDIKQRMGHRGGRFRMPIHKLSY